MTTARRRVGGGSTVQLLLGRVALFVVTSALLIGLLELAASVYLTRVALQPRIHQYDALLGWTLRPRLLVRRIVEGGRDFALVTNSLGLRSPEVQVPRPENVYRVLVLGDSMAYGHGVDVEERFDAFLRPLILDGRPVEVVNASVSGYGPDLELLCLSHRGLRFEPDLVLQLSHENDLVDISRGIHSGRLKPYYTLEGGSLTLHGSPVPATAWFRSHSYVFGFLASWLSAQVDEVPVVREDAQRLFAALRRESFRLAQEHGSRFVSVLTSDRDHLLRGEDRAWKRGLTANEPFPVIDLDPDFQAQPDPSQLYFAVDYHWNAYGHRLAGTILARELSRLVGEIAESAAGRRPVAGRAEGVSANGS